MRVLVGRERELVAIRERLGRARDGRGSLVAFTGEPGIGKSRLAEAAAEMAEAEGFTVAWGRSWEVGGAPALWPWLQVFRDLGLDGERLLATSDARTARSDARFLLFDAATRTLKELAAAKPAFIVLDDLHAADVPSLLLSLMVARALRTARLLVLGTFRDAEARALPEVSSHLAKLAREAELFTLSGLTEADVAAWLTVREGEAGAVAAADLCRRSDGNPLFVEELLRMRQAAPEDGGETARWPVCPDGLAEVLDEHVRRLGAEARHTLELATVWGREFTEAEVATLGELDADEVHERLAGAVTWGVLEATTTERHRFVHVLLRDRLYQAMPPSRRAELHWRAGGRLASRGELDRAAHHYLLGRAAGDDRVAFDACLAAARGALGRMAFEDAVRVAERALAEGAGRLPSVALDLGLAAAEGYAESGQVADAKRVCLFVLELADKEHAHEAYARAALIYSQELSTGVVDPVMVTRLADALERLPDEVSPLRVCVMARYAAARVPPSTPEEADEIISLARTVHGMTHALTDTDARLYALKYLGSALGYAVDADERAQFSDELVALATAMDDRLVLLQVGGWNWATLLERGRLTDAEAALTAYGDIVAGFPQPTYQWRWKLMQAWRAVMAMDFERALERNQEAFELAERAESRPARVAWALQRLAIALARGEPESIDASAPRMLAVLDRGGLSPLATLVLASLGRHDEVRPRLQAPPPSPMNFPGGMFWALIASALRDEAIARDAYSRLERHADTNPMFWGPAGALVFGPTALVLGDLAVLLERPEDAARWYAQAMTVCERTGLSPHLRLARDALGRLGPSSSPSPKSSARASASAFGVTLVREVDVWRIESATRPTLRLKHGKGLAYLAELVARPGEAMHVLELAGIDEAPSDAGPVLDVRAKSAYRRRLADLAEDLEEAERFGDIGRARRAREEIDALTEELVRGVGLAGRGRRTASNVERARINVQRRLKDALARIEKADEPLGRYLAATVKTGTFCAFRPI